MTALPLRLELTETNQGELIAAGEERSGSSSPKAFLNASIVLLMRTVDVMEEHNPTEGMHGGTLLVLIRRHISSPFLAAHVQVHRRSVQIHLVVDVSWTDSSGRIAYAPTNMPVQAQYRH